MASHRVDSPPLGFGKLQCVPEGSLVPTNFFFSEEFYFLSFYEIYTTLYPAHPSVSSEGFC